MPAASSRRAIPAESPRRLANGAIHRKRGAQALQRELGRGARPMTRRSARRPPVIRRIAGATARPPPNAPGARSAAFVELVVDQGDKFRVIVSHCFTKERSYFSFANAARAAASLLMTVPIGTARVAAASA